MIRTILFILYIIPLFLITLVTFPFYALLRLCRAKKAAKKFINATSAFMGCMLVIGTGSRVSVTGKENLPASDDIPICVISNHQSFFDIPLLTWKIPFPVGFVAKRSLGQIPVLNLWLWALHCVMIDRKSPRSSVRAIEKAVDSIKAGYAMLIFPEGTRSRGKPQREFKKGSFKLPLRAGALIVPVTVDGVYNLFEYHGGIRPGKISMHIHKPIDVAALSDKEKDGLAERLQKLICADINPAW
ncbi:MAG: 1-acyl-sn-glycerol-3-phosphate acyltransferase [Spirochaetales bacterium]|nr:1-acyl-sn-glycerol-3-phosphate acyltransferase [Spirochaetales bacterium]